MDIKLSIIIPFHNVEPFIAQCLDSVYDQDIPENEYEVICVNDASPDHSRDIVLEYQKKHSNLILVEHEVNKKLGAARNTGRKTARGKYIWNVDSDDMIVPNCLGEILNVCETNDVDVLMFRHQTIKGDMISYSSFDLWNETSGVVNGFTFWEQQGIKHQSEISPVWLMVVRKAYLENHNIISPSINMNEDVPYTYKCILLASRILITNTHYYICRINESSLSSRFKKNASVEGLYDDMVVSSMYLYSLYKQIPKYKNVIRQSILNVVRYEFATDMSLIKQLDVPLRDQFAKKLRHNFRHVRFLFSVLSRRQSLQLLKLLLE